MDILDLTAISLVCSTCGDRYQVPLKQILLSQDMLRQGCPVTEESEFPPVVYARLLDPELLQQLQQLWRSLTNQNPGIVGAGSSGQQRQEVHNHVSG
jgi:hypothetical protein